MNKLKPTAERAILRVANHNAGLDGCLSQSMGNESDIEFMKRFDNFVHLEEMTGEK